MTLLLLHMKLEICTQNVIDQYLAIVHQLSNFSCYSYWYMMIVLDAYMACQFTTVSTWLLYTKCMITGYG